MMIPIKHESVVKLYVMMISMKHESVVKLYVNDDFNET